MLFQFIGWDFLYVEARSNATEQPEVCWWPSEMMAQYFSFQKEAKSLLLWSSLSERAYSTSMWNEWLFTSGILELPSALDLLASDVVGSAKSVFSTATTSMVLFTLISASVLQSNTEWFAILFKDRPIVRDYKKMLDIETELFDIAYFRSKQINLLLPVREEDFYGKFNKLLEKYKESGLFESTEPSLKNTVSMADVLQELVDMNTAMKHFILFLGRPWTKALDNYNWCFGEPADKNCTKNNAVVRFSADAVKSLKEAYSGLWTFGACNLYASNFKSTIFKAVNNNSTSVKVAFQDVKDAMKRLKWALVGDYQDSGDWKSKLKKRGNRCDMSEYEMAQLRAYWWSDWECWNGVDVSEAYSKVKEYFRNKKSQNDQRKKSTNVVKDSGSATSTWSVSSSKLTGEGTVVEQLAVESSNDVKRWVWLRFYGTGRTYNPEFNYDMDYDLESIYSKTMVEYYQSQQNAMAQDLAFELRKIKWLIDQVESTMQATTKLNEDLQAIADYQCTS